MNKTQQVQPGLPPFTQQVKDPTNQQRVAAAVKTMHGCINELLKAGRVASMEAASAIHEDFNTVVTALSAVDVLTKQVAELRTQCEKLVEELAESKKLQKDFKL